MNEKEEGGVISAMVHMAKLSRLYYDELIRNGFDHVQALELTKVQNAELFNIGKRG